MFQNNKIYCIVVTYNPESAQLLKVLTSIAKNSVNIVIVDNGSDNINSIETNSRQFMNTYLIKIPSNIGIAAAQNRGITFAIDKGAEMIWLSDQDSIYPENYIVKMKNCINTISADEILTYAAFGPAFFNTNSGHISSFVKFRFFAKKFHPKAGVNNVSHIIASGMIIPSWAFRKVGLKREDLFIDWVDMEWCWRASKKHGLKIAGCGNVFITHTLGDLSVNFFGRKVSTRSPFRHYFIVRNALALSLYSKSLYFNQRVDLLFRVFAYVLAYPIIASSGKYAHLKAVTKGFIHGLVNSLGPKH